MSLAIQRAKYQGDPGLFGALKGAVGGFFTGGVGGAIGGAVSGWKDKPAAAPGTGQMGRPARGQPGYWAPRYRTSTPQTQAALGMGGRPTPYAPARGALPPGLGLGLGPGRGMIDPLGLIGERQPGTAMESRGSLTKSQSKVGAPHGYHWNRSGYYLKSEGRWIEPGTRLVKDRKMNPLNPRAASGAMHRLGRAKKAASMLNRVTIRKKSCPKKQKK